MTAKTDSEGNIDKHSQQTEREEGMMEAKPEGKKVKNDSLFFLKKEKKEKEKQQALAPVSNVHWEWMRRTVANSAVINLLELPLLLQWVNLQKSTAHRGQKQVLG